MSFLTVESANKTEVYISTAREQKDLGKIGVRHDGYKVLVCHVVGHSRPASLAFAFAFSFFLYIAIVL